MSVARCSVNFGVDQKCRCGKKFRSTFWGNLSENQAARKNQDVHVLSRSDFNLGGIQMENIQREKQERDGYHKQWTGKGEPTEKGKRTASSRNVQKGVKTPNQIQEVSKFKTIPSHMGKYHCKRKILPGRSKVQ